MNCKNHTERKQFICANVDQLIRIVKQCILEDGCGVANSQMNISTLQLGYYPFRNKKNV